MANDFIDETSADIVDETKDNNNNNNAPKMKYCPHCGKLKPETARFCPECGRDRSGNSASDIQHGRQNAYGTPGGYQPAYAGQPVRGAAVQTQKNSGFSEGLVALIVSLVNFFMFGSLLSFISVPVVLIFAIIALKRGNSGRIMAVISIIVSILSALIFAFYVAVIVKLAPEIKYFADHDKEIIAEYYETGEIPERYEKFRDKKYDKIWSNLGYDDFDDFFGDIIGEYRDSVYDDEDDWYDKGGKKTGKEKTTKEKTTKEKTTKEKTTKEKTTKEKTTKSQQSTTGKRSVDRDGEDLVVLS